MSIFSWIVIYKTPFKTKANILHKQLVHKLLLQIADKKKEPLKSGSSSMKINSNYFETWIALVKLRYLESNFTK